MWELKDEFTDATIVCENGKLETKVHKILLAAASPFFRDAFKMTNIINLKEVSNEEVSSVVEFIYNGEITVQSTFAERFFEIARNLSLKISETVTKSQHSSHHQGKKEEASKNVLSLPPELLVNIFSHIPTYDLMQKVVLVSKYFNQLTKLPGAHIDVILKEYVNKNGAGKFLENKTLIRQLKIESTTPQENDGSYDDSDDESFDEDNDLDDESVVEDDNSDSDSNLFNSDSIVLSVCNHPHLRALELHGIRSIISFKAFIQLMESKCWKNLTILHIFIDFSPGYESVDEIKDFYHKAILEMGSNVGIKKLSFGGAFNFTDPDLYEYKVIDDYFEKVFKMHRNTLEELTIFGESQPFELCNKLKTLCFALDFDKFEKLPLLTYLTTLQILSVDNMYSYEAGTLPANSLPNLKSLAIDITNTFYNQKSLLEALANACPNLQKIMFNIRNDEFSKKLILRIIKTCSKLEEFSFIVWHVDETNRNVRRMNEQFKFHHYLPNLKYLHLDGWNLNDADVKSILLKSKTSSIEMLQFDGTLYYKGIPKLKERKVFFEEMKLRGEYDIYRRIQVSEKKSNIEYI